MGRIAWILTLLVGAVFAFIIAVVVACFWGNHAGITSGQGVFGGWLVGMICSSIKRAWRDR